MSTRPVPPNRSGAVPDPDEQLLEARLRIAELEQDRENLAVALTTRGALLDQLMRHRVWRGLERLERHRRATSGEAAVAAGWTGLGPDGVRIPLAGLPCDVDGEPPEWRDAIEVAGVTLGGAELSPPCTMRWDLTGIEGGAVRAFAALRSRAWMHNRGGVRFVVALRDVAGATLSEVVRDVHPGRVAEDRRWVPLVLALDGLAGRATTLELTVALENEAPPDFAWAVWGDPVVLGAPAGTAVRALPGSLAAPLAIAGRVAASARSARGTRAVPGEAPVISLLMPVHDPHPELLERTVASVRAQTSGRWQLCIADDGSTDPAVRALLADAAEGDDRVVMTRHDAAQGISAATNAALTLATGPYVATLDHDDVLADDAIARAGAHLVAHPDVDVLYSDNDKVLHDVHFAPALKPDWSPDLLRAVMYTLHLGVYRRALVEEAGGWRTAFDGAQDHDLVLRLTERTDRIAHLPETLYGWRAHSGSAALGDAKAYAHERGAAAVQEHLERSGIAARAEPLAQPGRYRVRYAVAPDAPVSVILTVRATDVPADVAAVAEALRSPGVEVRIVEGEGPWGARAVAGIAAAAHEHVVLIEDLAAPLDGDWRAELLGPLALPGVVASAPLVLDCAGRAAHAGVVLSSGVPLPVHPGAPAGDDGPEELRVVTDRAAAAGVVALRRADAFVDPELDRGALATLTAQLTGDGGRVVVSPHAPWRLAPSARATIVDLAALRRVAVGLRKRRDPFYNPRLWQDRAAHVVPRELQQTGLLADQVT